MHDLKLTHIPQIKIFLINWQNAFKYQGAYCLGIGVGGVQTLMHC